MSEGKNQTISVNEALNRNATNPASLDGQPEVYPKKTGGVAEPQKAPVAEPQQEEQQQPQEATQQPQEQVSTLSPETESELVRAEELIYGKKQEDLGKYVAMGMGKNVQEEPEFQPVRATYAGAGNYAITNVLDGDTVVAVDLDTKEAFSLRLRGVDADESYADGGQEARRYVADKLRNAKDIRFHFTGGDIYGRKISEIVVDGDNLSLSLLRDGYAELRPLGGDTNPDSIREYDNAYFDGRLNRKGRWTKGWLNLEDPKTQRVKHAGGDEVAIARAVVYADAQKAAKRARGLLNYPDTNSQRKTYAYYGAMRSEAGILGIAPAREQTKFASSVAWRCATGSVFPASKAQTKPAVKESPAPTVSTTSILVSAGTNERSPSREAMRLPDFPSVRIMISTRGQFSKIPRKNSSAEIFFGNPTVSTSTGNSSSLTFKIVARASESARMFFEKKFCRKLMSNTRIDFSGTQSRNLNIVARERESRCAREPKQTAAARRARASVSGKNGMSSHAQFSAKT